MTQKIGYTLEEAGEKTGCSSHALKSAIASGGLRARYAGEEVVIRHEDLVEWIYQLPTEMEAEATAVQEAARPGRRTTTGTAELSPAQASTDWFTTEDLAAAWQLSSGTLSDRRALKKGPEFVRLGGIVRYHRDAATAWPTKQLLRDGA
ncbi:helix-turn-helix domain-containing protein [Arthrobacter sp. SLBN-112]|jgi:hypothetical protein|uniref:helix-turn-helix domain-containing protein n=1 Tax=Arthrobacter sp. SLBN-112 TaxID=2768452 RepID=UPI00114FC986|nr:helix-turn-helix domain-containing protein [Arthrobacter sp. SLBN-112]